MKKSAKSFIYEVFYDNEFRFAPPFRVWQVGERKLHAGEIVPEHDQRVAELSLIITGKATFYVNRNAFPVREGCVFLNGMSEMHSIVADEESPLHMLFLGFLIDPDEKDVRASALRSFFYHPPKRILPSEPSLVSAFRSLMAEVHASDLMSNSLITAYMLELLCRIYRSAEKSSAANRAMHLHENSDNQLIYSMLEFLNSREGLYENLSLIADHLGYSYAWLERRFKEVMGETLSEYHARCRFEQAKYDLCRGKSVTEVSGQLGYSSASTFSRAFRKYCGETPSNFLKRAIGEMQADENWWM